MLKRSVTVLGLVCATAVAAGAALSAEADDILAGPVTFETDARTGCITNLAVAGDPTGMSFAHPADGKAFPSVIDARYQWGGGTVRFGGKVVPFAEVPGLKVSVTRRAEGGDLVERYAFRNTSSAPLDLKEIDIHVTFNDNYRPASELRLRRCHAHIWTGGSSAWVAAMRIGGAAPHLGLLVTEGEIDAYELKERGLDIGMSDSRGVVCLSPSDRTLPAGGEFAVAWRIFAHDGWEGFRRGMIARGGVWADASTYVVNAGETAEIVFEAREAALFDGAEALADGERLPLRVEGNVCRVRYAYRRDGEVRVELAYAGGRKRTHVELLGVRDERAVVDARVKYILANQVYRKPGDLHNGALLPYDPETGRMICEWEKPPAQRWFDFGEGAERMGMGVLLARYAQLGAAERSLVLDDLVCYAEFVRTKLVDKDGVLWGSTARPWRKRHFNYPWAALLFAETYRVTGDPKYLDEACRLQRDVYAQAGAKTFVNSHERMIVNLLRSAGRTADADRLVEVFRAHKDAIMDPLRGEVALEVNCAPEGLGGTTMQFLDTAALTGEQKYRDFALHERLPSYEACLGRQPSWRTHDIGLHHWDGFWFGKRRMWGDTAPHDWDGHIIHAFDALTRETGDVSYIRRARKAVRQMLGLFEADGRAHCAIIRPDRVNGEPRRCADPLMNDQDWALAFYLESCRVTNKPNE